QRPDIRMPSQREHQADGILIVVATRKPNDVDVSLPLRDRMRDVPRALDGVNDEHQVPHALTAVGPLVASPGWINDVAHLTRPRQRRFNRRFRRLRRFEFSFSESASSVKSAVKQVFFSVSPCLRGSERFHSYFVSVAAPVCRSSVWLRSSKQLARLCRCTHSPAAMSRDAWPIATPNLMTASP